MIYEVNYSYRADRQLRELYLHIAESASADIATKYIHAIVQQCDGLSHFPRRGAQRDDIGPGIRIFGFRRRVSIAFRIAETSVTILGIFYGGQKFEALLQEPED